MAWQDAGSQKVVTDPQALALSVRIPEVPAIMMMDLLGSDQVCCHHTGFCFPVLSLQEVIAIRHLQ